MRTHCKHGYPLDGSERCPTCWEFPKEAPEECTGCGYPTTELQEHKMGTMESEWLCEFCWVMLPDENRHNISIGLRVLFDKLVKLREEE